MTLSKSDYKLFLKHPAWLWLKKYDKAKLPPVNANTQDMFDAGHEFESYAEMLFPSATTIGFEIENFDTYSSMLSRTQAALDCNSPAILQGRLEADNLTCIFDVLEKANENTYDLIEIKSSSKVKPEHLYDLAFQTIVLEKSGIIVRNIAVICVNTDYVRKGEVDPHQITKREDVTEKVKNLIDITNKKIVEAFGVISQETMPDLSPRHSNKIGVPGVDWFTEWMNIYKHLNPNIDPYSIYNLSYPSAEQIGSLEDTGIQMISDVPDEQAIRPKQVAQIQTTKSNKQIIDPEKIREFLKTFEYPLYFFDYETFSSVIPFFDECQPYKDYPFQYSLHVMDSPDSEARHLEYLHSDSSNPMPALLSQLKQDIGKSGTVLTWNMSYEKGCNDRMATLYPEYKDFLDEINGRINDLMIPFSKMWFVDKDFFGSASIKKVLPVLAPDQSHKELNISDGLLARRMWTQIVLKEENHHDKEHVLASLKEYCTLDTYAMVRILEELRKTMNL